jgi:hypothetical protein
LKVAQEKDTPVVTLPVAITKPTQSARIRVTGVLTDPAYSVVDGQLSWQAIVRTPRATIVLPPGWQVTAVSVPATISTQADGRVVVQVFNGRPDEGVQVAVRATKQ